MSTLAFAALDGMLHYEFTTACEIFSYDPTGLADPWYEVLVCGSGPVLAGRFAIEPDAGLDRLVRAETVIVPSVADVDAEIPAELLDALRAAHAAGARLVSFCTGAFVLAAAGVLDGLRVTTHWAHTDVLAARYPRVHVDPDVLYVDNGRVLASAGKAAVIDLCLHLIRRDHGPTVANAVARRMVVPPHRAGGQAQFVTTPVPARADHPLADLLGWTMARLDRKLTVEDLARQANLSPRQLARQFRAATGTTPLHWLHIQRIRRAQDLLENTDRGIEAIAEAAGMGTATTLRRHFHAAVGVSPDAYRRTFAARAALSPPPA